MRKWWRDMLSTLRKKLMEKDDELEYEKVMPVPTLPSVAYREIRKVAGQQGVFTQDHLMFSVYQIENTERIGFNVVRADGSDATDDDMAAVKESMMFIAAPPANSFPI